MSLSGVYERKNNRTKIILIFNTSFKFIQLLTNLSKSTETEKVKSFSEPGNSIVFCTIHVKILYDSGDFYEEKLSIANENLLEINFL